MNKDIKAVLELANLAPSGENAQPWEFRIENNKVNIYNLADRDRSLYSWGQRASYVAHGALLENLKIAANNFSLNTEVLLFPESNITAKVIFSKRDKPKKDSNFDYIKERVSNRKPYSDAKLSDTQRRELNKLCHGEGGAELRMAEKKEELRILGKVGGTNEEIMLQNKELHNFFFSHINWTKDEDDKKKIGFYIKTLELPKPVEGLFKIIKHWKVIKALNKIGFAKNVGKQNGVIYSSSAAMGAVILKDEKPESYIYAGILLEKIWLTATRLGLSMQPLTGILFMHLMIRNGESNRFSNSQIARIKAEYSKASNIFQTDNKNLALIFRIGSVDPPSARSSRFNIESVIK